MRSGMTARQAREQAAELAGTGVEAGLNALGVKRVVSDLVGDAIAQVGGAVLGHAPDSVRSVAEAAGEVLGGPTSAPAVAAGAAGIPQRPPFNLPKVWRPTTAAGPLNGPPPPVPAPLPREMDPRAQAMKMLAEMGVTPGQVLELKSVGERVAAGFERLDSLATHYSLALHDLETAVTIARQLVEDLRGARVALEQPATKKPTRKPRASNA